MRRERYIYRMVSLAVLGLVIGLIVGSAGTSAAAEQKVVKWNYQGQWGASEKENWAAEQMKLDPRHESVLSFVANPHFQSLSQKVSS